MDAKGNDESRNRRREETLAQRVGEALDQMHPGGAGACPDAEIIAAYADRGLALDETVQWESHFATCARCRKILRVLAASSDTPLAESEVARLGELVATARVPARAAAKPAKIARPWAWDWRLRWLAPALGAAAVLAIWLALRPPWRTAAPGASTTLVAQAPKEVAPPISGPADQLPPGLPLEDKQALKNRSSHPNSESLALDSRSKNAIGNPGAARDELRSVTRNQVADNSALQKKEEFDRPANEREARLDASSPPAPAPPPPPPVRAQIATGETSASPQSNAKSAADLSSQMAAASPAPAPIPPSQTKPQMGALARSAPLPDVRAKADRVAPAAPEAPQQTTQSVTVTEAAPMVKTEATNGTVGGAGASAGLPVNGRNYESFAQRSATLFKAPSGSVLWRTASGGKIERSNDSGRSWQAQVSPYQEDWLSGAAVSDTVCWLAGRNGAIARTLDGERWDRISPPAQAAAGNAARLPDWTGIAARDAQSATVTASDGRRFATADGGKTWQAQQ